MIESGSVPTIDLQLESAVQRVCLEAAEAGLLASAHDCADGGLAVSLAESCFSSLNRSSIGAEVVAESSLSQTSLLFSESPSRIVLSFPPSSLALVEDLAARANCPITILGQVGGDKLRIKLGDEEIILWAVSELEDAWRGSLAKKLDAEVMVAGRE
jgi:phosphoribosylformylglycinamidine synthase